MKKLKESSVILRFSDDEGAIHDVSLGSLMEGGLPIDEESGEDMEYVGAYLSETSENTITEGEWKYTTTDKGRPKVVDRNGFTICTAGSQPYNHDDFKFIAEMRNKTINAKQHLDNTRPGN